MADPKTDRLKKLLGLGPVEADIPAPAADTPYNFDAADLRGKASKLEGEAAPPPAPHGFGGILGAALQAGLEGFTGGYTGGPGYAEHQAQRDAQEHTRQSDLLSRAKELRGEATHQQEMGQTARDRQLSQEHQDAMLRETQSQHELEAENNAFNQDMATSKQAHDFEVADRPKPFESSPGSDYGHTDPKTGTHTVEGTTAAKPTSGNLQSKVIDEGHGKLGLWAVDMTNGPNGGTPVKRIGDAPPSAASMYGEPLVQVYDEALGRNVYKARKVASGETVNQPPAVLKEQRDQTYAADKIEQLGKRFNPDWVGPGTSTLYKAKEHMPGVLPFSGIPEGYGDFVALQTDLQNNMIKLITGAQMSEPEAARILRQIPSQDDRPEMWMPKYKQTQANAKMLLDLIHRQTGTPGGPAAPGAGGDQSGFIKPGGALESLIKGGG